ncbi:hypothetical protein AALA69_07985 [Eggerthellaceae bacterium 24-137]
MEVEKTMPVVGDRVRFEFEGSQILGSIFVIDARGGGALFGVCPSCDVKADDGILYKHIPLDEITLAPA